ncbi:MAG: glycoside hydrolase family 65 protein [Pseudomonadota bacterium]
MDGWTLVYEGFETAEVGKRETLTALGNGRLVSRGALCFASADGTHYPGTYLAGLYNRRTSRVGDREVENEDLVNLPNWVALTFRIEDGDWLAPAKLHWLEHRQTLDLERGVQSFRLRVADDEGRVTRLEERRLVSVANPRLAALHLTLTPENWSGRMTVRSTIDGGVVNAGVERYSDLERRHLETLDAGGRGEVMWLRSRTLQSRVEIALAARLRVQATTDEPVRRRSERRAAAMVEEVELVAEAGRSIEVEKVAAYVTSRDRAIAEPVAAAISDVVGAAGFRDLLAAHETVWRHRWQAFDVRIESCDDPVPQLQLRLHVFHLQQTLSPHTTELDAGVPPRGWHGEAYRGHVMWDELFILPSLNLRMPQLTRAMLGYRWRRLPAARAAARAAGLEGAMFPWQSGSDGREESQRWHLNPLSGRWVPDNSWRQRHIGAAIAFNAWKYYEATDDRTFLAELGAELILEIARFWSSLARQREDGRFGLEGVMGPDEFHTAYPDADPSTEGGLANNAYTNVMAAWVLARALDVLDVLPEQRSRALQETLGIDEAERERWDAVSRGLVVPMRDDGVIAQFEGFFDLEPFPFDDYRERYPNLRRLDRILEKEGEHPNRYQVAKQADVLMLFYLFSREELQAILERLGYGLDPAAIFTNIRFYLGRTVHGSTLSWLTHAWVLARADRERSWELARTALASDFSDLQGGTTAEGIHLGAMAGTVDLVERCYTGLEIGPEVLRFNPHLPEEVASLATRLHYRRHFLDVEVTHEQLTIASRPTAAAPITIAYRGTSRALGPGQRCAFKLLPEQKPDRPLRVREQAKLCAEAEARREGEPATPSEVSRASSEAAAAPG